MPVVVTRRDEQAIPGLERDDAPVKVYAQRAFHNVSDVANVAPVFGTITGLKLYKANLPRPLAIDLLPHVRSDLLPLNVIKGNFI